MGFGRFVRRVAKKVTRPVVRTVKKVAPIAVNPMLALNYKASQTKVGQKVLSNPLVQMGLTTAASVVGTPLAGKAVSAGLQFAVKPMPVVQRPWPGQAKTMYVDPQVQHLPAGGHQLTPPATAAVARRGGFVDNILAALRTLFARRG